MRWLRWTNWFFFWFLLFFSFSLVYQNWDRILLWFAGPPPAEDLSFNRPEALAEPAVRLVTQDEKINMEVFAKTHQAVVNIATTTLSINFWRQIIPRRGLGTGFIIDERGYILTNDHVVEDASRITVTLGDGRKVEALLIGRAPSYDMAVIKIPARLVSQVARLGNSDEIRVGQKAIAIGNPFGLSHTLTVGIISALRREIMGDHGRLYDLIQTDAAINPGNSGGPLLNSNAEVIGITTAIFTLSGGYQGIGFAIPVNQARQVATELITRGKYAQPWLGISGISLTPDLAQMLKLASGRGVLVAEVAPGSPADKAGLRAGTTDLVYGNTRFPVGGDVILSVNGKRLAGMSDLIEEIRRARVGDRLRLTILRDQQELLLEVVLEESPA